MENAKDSKSIAFSLVTSLKACAKREDLSQGRKLHAEIRSAGLLEKNPYLGNTLISMYAKCGELASAQRVLDELPVQDVASWNALIAGYAQHGQGEQALGCFHRMRSQNISPDAVTYACILKACGITRKADMGRQIHDEILNQGLLEKDVVLGNALVDMYAKCGALAKAQAVLDELPIRNVVSWTTLIAGYTQHGQGENALNGYLRMRKEGLSPNAITYTCILKACGLTQEAYTGKNIHDEIVSQGLLMKNVILGNALIDMYAKCGALTKAQEVLEELHVRDVVSWSTLIAGYAQRGEGKKALGCLLQMRAEGLSPNAITYACILKVCGITREPDIGKDIHDTILSQALLEKNVALGNALVDMYAKCGVLTKAQEVLDKLLVRDVISWNALIGGYVEHGQCEGALRCFQRMRSEGLSPDEITYALSLKTCGILQESNLGKEIHDEIVERGLLEKDVMLGTALVDMYAKCGVLRQAERVLDELHVRNIVSWSALIAGYAQFGQGEQVSDCFERMRLEGLSPDVVSWNALIEGYAQRGLYEEALDCFNLMQREGTSPDALTFLSVLNACSHAGLVEEGEMHLENMRKIPGLTPEKEHYTTMVDLFGRARLFDKAMKVIKETPFSNYPPIWYALLGACQKWKNVKLGRLAFEHAVQLDARNAAAYIVMASIYTAAGMQEDAQIIEHVRVKHAAWKKTGYESLVGETKHLQNKHMYTNSQKPELEVFQQRYTANMRSDSHSIFVI